MEDTKKKRTFTVDVGVVTGVDVSVEVGLLGDVVFVLVTELLGVDVAVVVPT